VVGDFRALLTVTVFRTVTVTEATLRAGLSQEAGYEICVAPQRQQAVRFDLLRSALTPAAADSDAAAYDFE
jgi:glycine cleavage system aminomethyltransferase T